MYSRVFFEACREEGLTCQVVTGNSNGMYGWDLHAWNRVKSGGKWYYYDVTWYDCLGSSSGKKYLGVKSPWNTHKAKTYTKAGKKTPLIENMYKAIWG